MAPSAANAGTAVENIEIIRKKIFLISMVKVLYYLMVYI